MFTFAYNWTISRERENYKQGNKFYRMVNYEKFTQLKKQDDYKEWLEAKISNIVTKLAIKDTCMSYIKRFSRTDKYPNLKVRNILSNLSIR